MATLQVRLSDLATRAATEDKALRTLINGNQIDLSALSTTEKSNLVAAINEIVASVAAINPGALINDSSSSSTTETWSIDKITQELNDVVASILNGAPAALDTLEELSAAIGDDANFAANITASLSNRLRFDAAQALSAVQQAQARANIGAIASADIGDPDTDLVALFEAGLV